MIDFVKLEVLGVDIQSLKENEGLGFGGKYYLSGEVETRRIYGGYKEMKITIHDNRRVFLEGSLPIMVAGNNYENLKHDDFVNGVNELELLFGVSAENFILQNFEFGFSVDIGDKSATDFLIEDLIDYKGEIRSEDNYKKNGYGITFRKSQFQFKLYDKSSQYNLADNVLRIEIRVKTMDYVKRLYQINTLKDLTSGTLWYQLKNHLVGVVSDLVICSMDNVDFSSIPQLDLWDIFTWKNPEFWRSNRPKSKACRSGFHDSYYQKMRKEYYSKKKKFSQLIEKYELDKPKKHILKQINNEYRKVLPTPPLMEEYDIGFLHRKTKFTPRDFMDRK